jgi:probable rRNA maturation factor
MTARISQDAQPPAAGDEGSGSDSEQPRTCSDILVEDDRWLSIAGFPELIPSLASATLKEAKLAPEAHAVSVALMSGSAIRALNKTFRGKDAPTNVLSFPPAASLQAHKSRNGPAFLGDVALSYETVFSEALEQEKPPLHHAAHLVVHGVLHLAGFDHGSGADADRMEAAERVILAKFGIPDPYGDEAMPSKTVVS